MADDVKIQVVAAPAAEAEAAKPAETSVETLTDNVAIVTFVERELLKLPGVRSKSLYSLAEGDRGFNRNCITFKLTTDYTVRDEDVLAPWKKAFNLRYWQHCPEALKEHKPSGWLKDNMTCEVSETVQLKYWSFKFPVECLSVLREQIAVEKGAIAVGVRKVTDFY
jgi:hypothetical protein